jgi:dTDP-4-amino-4,6-dideoxygalactose transaminase
MDMSDLARHAARDIVFETYPERGWNARMTDMQAALGLCQLEALDEILERRRAIADRYTQALAHSPALEPPFEPSYAERTWQSYCVRITPDAQIGRTELMRRLLQDGVPTRRGVMAIHHEYPYAAQPAPLPHTDAAAAEVLMLPLCADLSDDDQDYVLERLAFHTGAFAGFGSRAVHAATLEA